MGCFQSKTQLPDPFLTSVDVPIKNISTTSFAHLSNSDLEELLLKYKEADLHELHELLLEKRVREARKSHESHLHMHRANYYFV